MEETLSKHPKVRKIIDLKTVICICSKQVRLNKNYDPDLLDHHTKNKICKSNDGNSQITQFFSIQDSGIPLKRKLCIGLNDEKVKLYLHCVGFVTTFGAAPPPKTIARELFGNKIKSSFYWKDLNQEKNNKLLNTLQSRAKWINNSTTFCIRSTDCLTYVDKTNEVWYICDYFEGNINNINAYLKIWPTDDEIRVLINDAYKEANVLAKCVSIEVTLNFELLSTSLTDSLINDKIISLTEENLTKENSTKECQNEEEILTEIAKMMENIASLNLQDNIDEDLIDACKQIKNLSNYNSLEINSSIVSKIVAQITNNNNNSRLPKA
ncbi:1737_t:CDS:2 [Racocetra fulgida]|uniref:1737_t:CDS:1 n=1 Tax=Racocetra fulgida TaxID=60492 RepID=A0A9N9C3F0_9GLOM|nr:1737_t:CDS:2 [Racocetra fulgida]